MSMQLLEVCDASEKSQICKTILMSLPLWFGMQEGIDGYCDGVKNHSFIKVCDGERVVGFASVKINNKYVAEIYVMGLLIEYHRKGIGKTLIEHIEADLRRTKFRYLEVKTLDESRESEEYRRTRMFYVKCGFIPIDTLLHEWGKENPCLLMIKSL
jgi:ribosomal protein S18 acetylase RimI-like enzyme